MGCQHTQRVSDAMDEKDTQNQCYEQDWSLTYSRAGPSQEEGGGVPKRGRDTGAAQAGSGVSVPRPRGRGGGVVGSGG